MSSKDDFPCCTCDEPEEVGDSPPWCRKCDFDIKYHGEDIDSAAIKHDQGKPDLSQVTLELVELLARVRMFGEKKYARDNWKKGFKVTRSCAAALRHIFQFLNGETNDEESKLPHLGHAIACLEHAIYDMIHHPKNDDRYKGEYNDPTGKVDA